MVDRLVLALVRPNCGHTLDRVEVLCRKYGRSLKVAKGPGYLTEQFDQRLWIVEAPVRQKTEAIELRLFGRGYLIPYEILVVEARQQQGEAMKTYSGGALAGWFVLAAAAAPAAQQPVVVENPYVPHGILPGGRRSLQAVALQARRQGTRLRLRRRRPRPVPRPLLVAAAERDYADVAYQHEVTQTPGGTSIHLSGRGAGGIYSFTEIHKTITLARDSALIPGGVRDQEHRRFHDRRRLRLLGAKFSRRPGGQESLLHSDHPGSRRSLQRSRATAAESRVVDASSRPRLDGRRGRGPARPGLERRLPVSQRVLPVPGLGLADLRMAIQPHQRALRPELEDGSHVAAL